MTFLIKIKHLGPTNHKGKRFKASSRYSDTTMTRAYQYNNNDAEIIALALEYFESIRPEWEPVERSPETFGAELLAYDDTSDVVIMRNR